MRLPAVLRDLLTLPTAPFVERAVLDYIETACRRLDGVGVHYDEHGNLVAHYRRQSRGGAPLAFVAHTDHPGFVATEMVERRVLRAAFHGGVKPEYFTDARVRFWTDGHWVKGVIQELSKAQRMRDVVGWVWRPEEVLVRVRHAVAPGSAGMWDLPDPYLHDDLVLARGCDDLAGSAALLALLQRLSRAQAAAEVYCLFTRAEEVGFAGAIGAARSGTLPKNVPVFSIETSSALANAAIGAGPILRVGDRAAIFSDRLCGFGDRVARELAERRRRFRYQRRLMDGGTCEAIPFIAYGYEAAGICVALGNYHNMDVRRQRIGSEAISLSDWLGMVDLFEALVLSDGERAADWASIQQRMEARYAQYEPLLHNSAGPKP